MPQQPAFEVGAAAVRVDDRAVGALRHRVDRQVAPLEVLLQRHLGRELGDEAAIPGGDLALQPRERVFLGRLGMQEHGEIAAHGAVAEALHLLRRCADDDPVALVRRQPQQLVTDRTADEVDLHARMLTEASLKSVGRWARLLLSGALASGLGACGTAGYLLQAAHGEARLLARRRPLDSVIADPATSTSLRTQLESVRAARDFAVRELGLPDNASYRSYADIGRPYVVWNVIAAPEFSVEPQRWCFPFTGCVAYRGYFREANARRYAARLERRGYDVLVAGVSGLFDAGAFRRPGAQHACCARARPQLVATLFHELAHQLLYVRGDTEFNEAFAMTVEQEGLARWLAAQGREPELAGHIEQRRRQAGIAAIFAAARGGLAALYRSGLPPEELRPRKRAALDEAGRAVLDFAQAAGAASGYEAWIDAGLNNAHLAAVSSYHGCMPGFQRLLAGQDGDLPRFYAAARALGRGAAEQRRALCAGGAVTAGRRRSRDHFTSTLMRFGSAAVRFGMMISSTPFTCLAWICSASALSGSVKRRRNEPDARSRRSKPFSLVALLEATLAAQGQNARSRR